MTTSGLAFACGLAAFPCGKAWWAVLEEERPVTRLSGIECPACGELAGRFVSARSVVSTMKEALATIEQMRQENLDVFIENGGEVT
jgi:hypothetical protein